MTNQITQQPKLDQHRKAVASLVLGILSIMPIITRKLILPSLTLTPQLPFFLQIILFVVFFILPLGSIAGLILGIMDLNSTKRNFAIAGIILCVIGLLVPIVSFLLY